MAMDGDNEMWIDEADDSEDSSDFSGSESSDDTADGNDSDDGSYSSLTRSSGGSNVDSLMRQFFPHYYDDDEEYVEPPALVAVKNNNIEAVRSLITKGLDVNDKINGTYCIHEAIKTGNPEMVKLLLDSGSNLGCVDVKGRGPLHIAIQIQDPKKRWEMVRIILDAGVSLPEKEHLYRGCQYNTTCIHEAVRSNDFLLVLLLVDAGAEINCFDGTADGYVQDTPLQVALTLEGQSRYEMVQKLIAAGSDVRLCHNGYTVLHTAVVQETCDWELVQLLLDAGAQLNCLSRLSISPVALATKFNRLDLVKKMIDAGADINISKTCYNSALNFAITNHNKDLVDLLLKSGADVNARDSDGKSILYAAVSPFTWSHSFNKTDILKMILNHGAIMSSPEFGKYTPFKVLIENGNIEAINLFIENGFNLEDCGIQFPLHKAAINPRKEVLHFLLNAYLVDVDAIDDRGVTALYTAVNFQRADNVRLLVKWGASANIGCLKEGELYPPTVIGRTALGEAFATGESEFGRILLAAGASLDLAIKNQDIECIVKQALENTFCINQFIEYVVLLKTQGHFVDPANTRYAMRKVYNSSKIVEDCIAELEHWKTIMLHNDITMYDVLIGRDITPYISNPKVNENYESTKFDGFCHYGRLIKERYSFSLVRREVMDLALKGLSKILGFGYCTHEISFWIVKQLPMKDLRNLCII
ncbi:hypothetical protein QAD02_019806 [Eretmocerus hayati]|uniref:Uncharacterized protein n=1 Tax=Eretmocerus hayati TaxID=131215 RepID=A0ACC2PL43_9HYME|nr:hypothetical protein QAD02_019806 [Eretmocerus hayati]